MYIQNKKRRYVFIYFHLIFCTQLRLIAHFYYQWLSILSTLKIREGEKLMMSVAISAWKICSIRLCLQLFVGGLMSYLRCLCLFAHSGVQHILCCAFVLFFFVLSALYCWFLWIVHFWLTIRCSLTFIKIGA